VTFEWPAVDSTGNFHSYRNNPEIDKFGVTMSSTRPTVVIEVADDNKLVGNLEMSRKSVDT